MRRERDNRVVFLHRLLAAMNRYREVAAWPSARAGDKEQPPSPDIDGLIKQLGSRTFREREAASKALEKVGKPALERLRRAAKDDPDAEVRRRAGALVERTEQRLAPVLAMRIISS
jgi:hypothetical protein